MMGSCSGDARDSRDIKNMFAAQWITVNGGLFPTFCIMNQRTMHDDNNRRTNNKIDSLTFSLSSRTLRTSSPVVVHFNLTFFFVIAMKKIRNGFFKKGGRLGSPSLNRFVISIQRRSSTQFVMP